MTTKRKHIESSGSSQLDLWGVPRKHKWEDFEKAREYARSLDLQDKKEWEILWRKRGIVKPGIPENPDEIYKNSGWQGWNDWLGISERPAGSNITSGKLELPGTMTLWDVPEELHWLPFDKARQSARRLCFEYEEEWKVFIEGKFPDRDPLPDNIPPDPDQIYKFRGWKGWKDWLVTPENRIEYTNFHKARDFSRSLKIGEAVKWRDFLTHNTALLNEYGMILPERPHLEYKEKGWESWEDWLGLNIKYHDFKTTRKFIHSLKLSNKNDWIRFCSGQLTGKLKRSENIYAYPEIAFNDEGWNGWEDWLGTDPAQINNSR